jgi:hypothetical protein
LDFFSACPAYLMPSFTPRVGVMVFFGGKTESSYHDVGPLFALLSGRHKIEFQKAGTHKDATDHALMERLTRLRGLLPVGTAHTIVSSDQGYLGYVQSARHQGYNITQVRSSDYRTLHTRLGSGRNAGSSDLSYSITLPPKSADDSTEQKAQPTVHRPVTGPTAPSFIPLNTPRWQGRRNAFARPAPGQVKAPTSSAAVAAADFHTRCPPSSFSAASPARMDSCVSGVSSPLSGPSPASSYHAENGTTAPAPVKLTPLYPHIQPFKNFTVQKPVTTTTIFTSVNVCDDDPFFVDTTTITSALAGLQSRSS